MELRLCLSVIIMSLIKNFLYERDEEQQELWLELMEFYEENKELFSQLPKKVSVKELEEEL